ncbi:branched-chain amino acid ABC transporter permease [Paraburkholderia azotifigens]|uniref:Branched-chain amino acid ABC transporter permease n=1 Tax=Paraburkholderia azotifigens TaxID=2057004 RepID=A0A5C6VQM5_9BURK|nr:branched-chain amino acid ABC transporter permease [Paraburkholderia azotifigens]TXC87199.1 branched-chain amino acid ABC transporter permease [Paraburkholderia azotifigens]
MRDDIDVHDARPVARRMQHLRAALPWIALALLLAVPPCISKQSWLVAWLAQTASMIVFALSYNLLLGGAGLLSFGHAASSGIGALIAAQVFNRFGLPLPLLPLMGGIGGALFGALYGLVATRRAGTAFAMITLGIGELVAAAAWTLPDWFGGEAGVAIDRTAGLALPGVTFGPAREAYALIALWCALAVLAIYALSRTPFMRLAHAVRDNPVRAAAIGCYPRRVRYEVVVWSSFFAGIAGTLGLINVELVSTESVGMLRSGSVLIATVIGGSGAFFGPVAGAVVLTFFSVVVASATRAWLLYLGLFFVVVVVAAPDGIAGWLRRQAQRLARDGWRACLPWFVYRAASASAWTLAVVLGVQWAYAQRFGTEERARFLAATNPVWLAAAVLSLAFIGWLALHLGARRDRALSAGADAGVRS